MSVRQPYPGSQFHGSTKSTFTYRKGHAAFMSNPRVDLVPICCEHIFSCAGVRVASHKEPCKKKRRVTCALVVSNGVSSASSLSSGPLSSATCGEGGLLEILSNQHNVCCTTIPFILEILAFFLDRPFLSDDLSHPHGVLHLVFPIRLALRCCATTHQAPPPCLRRQPVKSSLDNVSQPALVISALEIFSDCQRALGSSG